MQKNIATQMKAMELAMNLEASPIGDGVIGMIQFQSQLANFTIQIQDIKRGKEV